MGGLSESIRLSDAELVAAYQAGDEQAAAELVLRHASAAGRFLHASGALPADLEDLVQEAFYRAFRRLSSWRQDAAFRTWLLAIAGNLVKDAHRSRRGRDVVSLEGHDVPDHRDPSADLQAGEAEQRLQGGIAALPRLQREVFLLRVQEGAGYADIARALGTTPGAARVHYHHAVKRLKEIVS